MFYNITFYFLHVYPLQHHLLLFIFHINSIIHMYSQQPCYLNFKLFTTCRVLLASSIIYKQQTKKSGGVRFQDKNLQGCKCSKDKCLQKTVVGLEQGILTSHHPPHPTPPQDKEQYSKRSKTHVRFSCRRHIHVPYTRSDQGQGVSHPASWKHKMVGF